MEQEAEKYQQRLQAIAEKRRLQEEHERARREREDERLRLQRLKRMSLRDQWLMEAPPSSPDRTGPQSPLWTPTSPQTHTNKLEEELKLKKHIEDGFHLTGSDAQTHDKEEMWVESVITAAVTDTVSDGPVMQNGKDDKKDDSVHENHSSKGAETTSTAVTNGVEEETSPRTSDQEEPSHTNDLQDHHPEDAGLDGDTMTFLDLKEAESEQKLREDDDAGQIIRTERVIITDKEEETPEEDVRTTQQSDTNKDGAESTGSAGVVEETEIHPEASAHMDQDEVSEAPQSHADPAEVVVADMADDGEQREGEELPDATYEMQDETTGDSVEASQAPACSTTSPTTRSKTEDIESQVLTEEKTMATTRISLSEFQEVPLDGETSEPRAKTGCEKQPAEQEPLLISRTATQLDTSSPSRAEDTGAPKQKTCQCCSIM